MKKLISSKISKMIFVALLFNAFAIPAIHAVEQKELDETKQDEELYANLKTRIAMGDYSFYTFFKNFMRRNVRAIRAMIEKERKKPIDQRVDQAFQEVLLERTLSPDEHEVIKKSIKSEIGKSDEMSSDDAVAGVLDIVVTVDLLAGDALIDFVIEIVKSVGVEKQFKAGLKVFFPLKK